MQLVGNLFGLLPFLVSWLSRSPLTHGNRHDFLGWISDQFLFFQLSLKETRIQPISHPSPEARASSELHPWYLPWYSIITNVAP